MHIFVLCKRCMCHNVRRRYKVSPSDSSLRLVCPVEMSVWIKTAPQRSRRKPPTVKRVTIKKIKPATPLFLAPVIRSFPHSENRFLNSWHNALIIAVPKNIFRARLRWVHLILIGLTAYELRVMVFPLHCFTFH